MGSHIHSHTKTEPTLALFNLLTSIDVTGIPFEPSQEQKRQMETLSWRMT